MKDLCQEKNLHYIDQSNSINTRHLNGSKLHLNVKGTKGTKILFSNFVEAISNILLWHSITHNLTDSNCVPMIDAYKVEPMNMKGIESLKAIQKHNLNRIVVTHLNINSLRNKFDYLIEQIMGNIDILMISETKLSSSFPIGQFLINGYSEPFRIDRNSQGGGIMLYVREDIPSKLLRVETSPTEGLYVEINFREKNGCFIAPITLTKITFNFTWKTQLKVLPYIHQTMKI